MQHKCDARTLPNKFRQPIPSKPGWSDTDYAAEILTRIEELLAHYEIDIDNLNSEEDALDALCRVLFDWVPGLQAEHLPGPVQGAAAGAVFAGSGESQQPGVAQPVSDRLHQALQQYRTMDPKKSRREELQRFVERCVSVDAVDKR